MEPYRSEPLLFWDHFLGSLETKLRIVTNPTHYFPILFEPFVCNVRSNLAGSDGSRSFIAVKLETFSGEERCETTLITAAKETSCEEGLYFD